MAIPNGTKFHGVAPNVPTDNLGSASLNAKRNVYTYPNDFNIGGGALYSYTGVIIDFAGTATGPFTGDTVEWVTASPTNQTAVLMFPEAVEITHLFAKVLQPVTTSGGFDYVFKLFKGANILTGDPNQFGTWTTVSSSVGGGFSDDGTAAWGLSSGDLTGTGLVIPANNMMAMAGVLQGGAISGTTTEAIVGIVAKPFSV